jgi:hypothetical protein
VYIRYIDTSCDGERARAPIQRCIQVVITLIYSQSASNTECNVIHSLISRRNEMCFNFQMTIMDVGDNNVREKSFVNL